MSKRERERSALHSTITRIADNMWGTLGSWDFNEYVLGFLFYRFISENLSSYIKSDTSDKFDFDYATWSDSVAKRRVNEIIKEKGFFILPSQLFENVCREASNNENLHITLRDIFKNIEDSAELPVVDRASIKGLLSNLDVSSSKMGLTTEECNKKLVKLLQAIGDLPIGRYEDNDSIDLLGDAYEYLMTMTMYTRNSGKSRGEFFTPHEVSELLARLTVIGKEEVGNVYDPACGSGSLLLKFAKVLGKENIRGGFYGQEINSTTYDLCRMNMFLHNIEREKIHIALGDTLTGSEHGHHKGLYKARAPGEAPKYGYYSLFEAEAIVSNPPYSTEWDNEDPWIVNDPRFTPARALAPKSKSDLAFVMHSLYYLSDNGTAAIVLFPGVMYREGKEQRIRKYLVDNNYVDAVIQLPGDLFFGTTIATCILVMKKNRPDNRVLFIDALKEFECDKNKHKLGDENIKKILDCYAGRETCSYFSRLVDCEEIIEKDYNLSVERYVESEDAHKVIDIKKLNAEIDQIVARQNEFRSQINEFIAELEGEESLYRQG